MFVFVSVAFNRSVVSSFSGTSLCEFMYVYILAPTVAQAISQIKHSFLEFVFVLAEMACVQQGAGGNDPNRDNWQDKNWWKRGKGDWEDVDEEDDDDDVPWVDLRKCKKCNAWSYLRKGGCVNIKCGLVAFYMSTYLKYCTSCTGGTCF